MKKEDIKKEATYMHIFTGSVDSGKGWLETLADHEEEVSEDLPLIEVVKDAGNWVEA